jgi:N-acetylmuramoyl-L-alanine amidase
MSKFVATADTVHQAQGRLAALGHDPVGDERGVLGRHTSVALQAFQRQRGLPITGDLDGETWNRLLEAGWSMGDRLLYVHHPHLRGDDVAALQEALALLGFNPGRIDGIFGALTEHALADFQRNCGVEPTGVLDRETLNQLTRLSSRSHDRRPVTEARDATALLGDDRQRLVVIHGATPLATSLAVQLGRTLRIVNCEGRDERASATFANEHNAGLLFSFSRSQQVAGLELTYFESYRSRSVVGQQLAQSIATAVRAASPLTVIVRGMAVPILRETLMPALVISTGPTTNPFNEAIADVMARYAVELFDKSR